MEIIVRRDGRDYGPYSVGVAQNYLASGQLKPSDFARLKGEPPTSHRTLGLVLSKLNTKPPPPQRANPGTPSQGGTPAPPKTGGAQSGTRTQSPPAKKRGWLPSGIRFPRIPPAILGKLLKPRPMAAALVTCLLLIFLVKHSIRSPGDHPEAPLPSRVELAAVPPVNPPSPLSTAESQLLRDADAYALAVGPLRGVTVPEFARNLRNPDGHSLSVEPLWKVRCIFRWIAQNISYDGAAIRSAHRRDYDPDAVLHTRWAVCEGYAALFTSLCQSVGVEAVTVSGYLHGSREEIGLPITPDTLGHAWNAARIGGRWILLDTTSAAGYLQGKKFVREFDAAWFDCPPERMIRSHFPSEDKWQLLPRPVSQLVFQQFPVVKPRFFSFVSNAGAFTEGTLPAAAPFLRFSARHDVQFMSQLVTRDGREIELSIVQQPNPAGSENRVEVVLPAGGTPGGYVEVYTHGPGDAAGRHELTAVFRVGKWKGGDLPAAAVTAQSSGVSTGPHGSEGPTYFADYHGRHARLDAPLNKYLPANSWQHFRIMVPGARNVRLIQGTAHTFLHKTDPNTFEGDILVGLGTCSLNAAFEEGATSLPVLVEFEAR